MENAVQAFKMAAAVLVFIIAIASSFSLFGTARQTADSIVTMRDKQGYLDAAELDNGILYTSSSAIQGDTTGLSEAEIEAQKIAQSSIEGVTKNGDRIVKVEDIISTIYRYSTEKYGVTIIKKNGEVLARFDSATEILIKSSTANELTLTSPIFINHSTSVLNNIKTIYCDNPRIGTENNILELYKIINNNNANFKYGAPWYSDVEEIPKRIACDLTGTEYEYSGQKYTGKGLITDLKHASYIVEVTNEVDNSTYLKDIEAGVDVETNLLQQYEMPTIEIVYIIY